MGDALAPWHIIILLIVFMVLFGAKRLPGAAKSLGEAMKVFKSETKGLTHDGTETPAAAAPLTSTPLTSTPVPAPQPAQTQQQIEQLQRQLNDLQAKTAAADGVTVNGVPLSEAQPKQPS